MTRPSRSDEERRRFAQEWARAYPERAAEIDHANELLRLYVGQAERAADAEMWFLAVVILGSAIEALLLAFGLAFEPLLTDDPRRWTLGRAIKVATGRGWLSVGGQFDTDPPTELDEVLGVLLEHRNFIHPGRVLRTPIEVDIELEQKAYWAAYGIYGLAVSRMSAFTEGWPHTDPTFERLIEEETT